MTKLQTKDKSKLMVLSYIAVFIGVMIILICLFGKVDGLVMIVAMLIMQMGYVIGRISALERERQISNEPQEPTAK